MSVKFISLIDLKQTQPGERFEYRGNRFRVIENECYFTDEGEKRWEVMLQSTCRTCGRPYLLHARGTTQWLAINCPEHRIHQQEPK